jgi:ADP-ribosylglycohydrolase
MSHVIVPDLILPALIADALCLGPHWLYDQQEIARLYPQGMTGYDAPHSKYHPGKGAGWFTHYGDQTLALLRSIHARGGFDAEGWREDWSRFWASNTVSYRDGATRQTLDHLAHGSNAPSGSHDLGGASRIAPILAFHHADPLAFRVQAAREQTALTHGDAAVQDVAAFFVYWVDGIARGLSLSDALREAAKGDYEVLNAGQVLDYAEGGLSLDPSSAGRALGLSCAVMEALPLTLCLALRFADQPREALATNALIGGDSAARGLLLGLIMGAAHGLVWLPPAWTDGLNAKQELESLLNLPLPREILVA